MITILYLIGVALSLYPQLGTIVSGGIIAGTAAGHSWRVAGSRLLISILVIILMTVAVVGIPYVREGARPLGPPTFPTR